MAVPDLVVYATEEEYREHFHCCYVNAETPIRTIDGIHVDFFAETFDHAFFESSDRKNPTKDVFSIERARKIDWIRFAIEAENIEVFETLSPRGRDAA